MQNVFSIFFILFAKFVSLSAQVLQASGTIIDTKSVWNIIQMQLYLRDADILQDDGSKPFKELSSEVTITVQTNHSGGRFPKPISLFRTPPTVYESLSR